MALRYLIPVAHLDYNHSFCFPFTDQCLALRPRPASPFSTDGSTVGTHSLGHQRAARPTRKNRGPGTAVHRRDASADGKTISNHFKFLGRTTFEGCWQILHLYWD